MLEQIKIGHYSHGGTGVTVVLTPEGAVGGCSVRGAAPATRETALLDSHKMIQKIHAVCLSGGSAYGLDACGGVMKWLNKKGHGFDVAGHKIPIVCGASLFDLTVTGGAKPDADFGYKACENAVVLSGCQRNTINCVSLTTGLSGQFGAGTGATIGKICGTEYVARGGVGYSSREIGGLEIAALVVVNAVGDIVKNGKIIAGASEGGKFLNCNEALMKHMSTPVAPATQSNTTLGVIMTNADLTKAEVNKLADLTHNAYAMCISPVHTEFDGDVIFGLATGQRKADFNVIAASAIDIMKEAIWKVKP